MCPLRVDVQEAARSLATRVAPRKRRRCLVRGLSATDGSEMKDPLTRLREIDVNSTPGQSGVRGAPPRMFSLCAGCKEIRGGARGLALPRRGGEGALACAVAQS